MRGAPVLLPSLFVASLCVRVCLLRWAPNAHTEAVQARTQAGETHPGSCP